MQTRCGQQRKQWQPRRKPVECCPGQESGDAMWDGSVCGMEKIREVFSHSEQKMRKKRKKRRKRKRRRKKKKKKRKRNNNRASAAI